VAVDTRDKRFSFLAFGKQVPWVMPDPDGEAFTAADRFILIYLYPGLAPVISKQMRPRMVIQAVTPPPIEVMFVPLPDQIIFKERN